MGRTLKKLSKAAQPLDTRAHKSFDLRIQLFLRQAGNRTTHDRWSRYGIGRRRRVPSLLLALERNRHSAALLEYCGGIRQPDGASPYFVLTGISRRESIR